jgi:hypothetical protein
MHGPAARTVLALAARHRLYLPAPPRPIVRLRRPQNAPARCARTVPPTRCDHVWLLQPLRSTPQAPCDLLDGPLCCSPGMSPYWARPIVNPIQLATASITTRALSRPTTHTCGIYGTFGIRKYQKFQSTEFFTRSSCSRLRISR